MGGDTTRFRGPLRALSALAAGLAVTLAFSACSSADRVNPTQLRDTTGLKVPWVCNSLGCYTDALPGFATCDKRVSYTGRLDRLFLLCASTTFTYADMRPDGGTDVGSTWWPIDCRATACDADTDCPLFQGHTYVCRHGLCENPSVSGIGEEDLDALCLSSTARPTDCETMSTPDADALFTANCAPNQIACTLPSTCLQL